MNEKLLKIAHKQQNLEYLKKQNITSPHQLQELRNQIPGEYTSQILEQCSRMNHHTDTYRFSFILSNILACIILLITVVLLLSSLHSTPEPNFETPCTQAQEAIDNGDLQKARDILESTNTPSDTFAGALTYSSLYESEGNYDEAADVIITFITDVMGTQSILDASPLYTRMVEIGNMELSSAEKDKYETCMNACQQSAAKFSSISALIKEENYEDALKLCDEQKANGSSEYVLFQFYCLCYTRLEDYETFALKLIDLAEKIKEVGVRFDVCTEEVYPAKVVEVSKSTTRNNLSFLLTALLPNKQGKWPAGISGKMLLDFPASSSVAMVTVPQTALSHRPTEGDYVWTVDNATRKVSKKKVILGELLPNGKVEVKGGLQAGETVAVSKLRFLSEGTPVEIMNREMPVTAQK